MGEGGNGRFPTHGRPFSIGSDERGLLGRTGARGRSRGHGTTGRRGGCGPVRTGSDPGGGLKDHQYPQSGLRAAARSPRPRPRDRPRPDPRPFHAPDGTPAPSWAARSGVPAVRWPSSSAVTPRKGQRHPDRGRTGGMPITGPWDLGVDLCESAIRCLPARREAFIDSSPPRPPPGSPSYGDRTPPCRPSIRKRPGPLCRNEQGGTACPSRSEHPGRALCASGPGPLCEAAP